MKTIAQIEMKASKMYMQLEIGVMFDMYHDMMYDMMNQFDYLEDECDDDYKLAEDLLSKCKAIIEAQNILIKAKLN